MSIAVGRVLGVSTRRETYVSLGYVLLHLPFALVYGGIVSLALARGFESILGLVVLVPAGLGAGRSSSGARQ